MSTIFADKFKNTSGGNPVQINQLRGIDTAGSITVQGEGTATTNLQQGLTKFWANWDGTGTVSLRDSFNLTTLTDQGTGDYSCTFTNAMANTGYVHTANCGSGSGHIALLYSYGQNLTYRCRTYVIEESGSSPSVTDEALVVSEVSGDLA